MAKVLLDTDIGTDVDDAVALAYLLSHPDCELLGITTGNLIDFLETDPKVWQQANVLRAKFGQKPLRSST